MMIKRAAVLSLLMVAATAIPLKPDDMPRRIKQAEIDSNKDLDEFVQAWNNKDNPKLVKMTDFIINIANEGYQHSISLEKNLKRFVPVLSKLSRSGFPWPMRALAWIIDGNRDNESYYDLETVIQWINKRQAAGVKDNNLSEALAGAKESQDSLQAMADAFVSTIKTLKHDAHNMESLVDAAVKVMDEKSGPFLDRYRDSLVSFSTFRSSLRNNL